jgi:hypothetical protein
VICSSGTYLAQNFLFHRSTDTLFYFFQDLAFLPVQLLIGVLFADRYIKRKERESVMSKLNMVIGVFFSEAGMDILRTFAQMTANKDELAKLLHIGSSWEEKNFVQAVKQTGSTALVIKIEPFILESMHDLLVPRMGSILRLLENPYLMEHQRFTDLLWAITHLTEELHHRGSFDQLPSTDIEHLRGDIIRAYRLIVVEWLIHANHLRKHYPYLYSLAIRTNPFETASPVIIV